MSFESLNKKVGIGEILISGLGRPFGLALSPSGCLLVADMSLNAIFRFASDYLSYEYNRGVGGWIGPFELRDGSADKVMSEQEPLSLHGPHSVAVFSDGSFVVTCYYSAQLLFFDSDGFVVNKISSFLAGPATSTIDGESQIWTADYGSNSIKVFGRKGDLLNKISVSGDNKGLIIDRRSFADIHLNRPHMASVMSDTNILVIADTWNERLLKVSLQNCGYSVETDKLIFPELATTSRFKPVAVRCYGDELLVTDWGQGTVFMTNSTTWEHSTLFDKLVAPYDSILTGQGYAVAEAGNGQVIIRSIN